MLRRLVPARSRNSLNRQSRERSWLLPQQKRKPQNPSRKESPPQQKRNHNPSKKETTTPAEKEPPPQQKLGAKAICYLSHDTTGAANGVTISLTGADPRMKYTGSRKGTKRQLAEGVLGSQARRSTDIGTIVPRTQTKRALK